MKTKENIKRVYFDADGCLCEYLVGDENKEYWLKPGIFRILPPQQEVIDAAKELIQRGYEVYILTAFHKSTPAVKSDKLHWFKKHLPFINEDRIIFCHCGENKADYIPTGITKNDILLDDFNANLNQWQNFSSGTAIKVLNGINSKESWNGLSVSAFNKEEIINTIESL